MKKLSEKQKEVLHIIDKNWKMFNRKWLVDILKRDHLTKVQYVLEALYHKWYLLYIWDNMWKRTERKPWTEEELKRLYDIEKKYYALKEKIKEIKNLITKD